MLLGLGALRYGRYRAAGKFARSLMEVAESATCYSTPFVPRPVPFSLTQTQAVILKGPRLAGKTTLLSHAIKYDWYPWWRRWLSPPRGLFLEGNQSSPTADEWFRSQMDCKANRSPIDTLIDALQARESQQRLRNLLFDHFPPLPRVLQPQPSLLIIDQTEELLSAYRAEFLVAITPLVDLCTQRPGVLQLVFVVHSDEAVQSLKAPDGGTMFRVIEAPRAERSDVRAVMGEEFALAFDQLDRSIGITVEYIQCRAKGEKITPAAFLQRLNSDFHDSARRLKTPVTKDEITYFMRHRK